MAEHIMVDFEGNIEKSLKEWFMGAKKVVVAGIGNSFRRDDFVGVEIVRMLKNRVSKSVYLIEGETLPESFLVPITKFHPTHILLVDAGMLNLNAGSSKLVDPNQLMKRASISTHMLPLRLFCDYLKETTDAKLTLLVIQPEDTSFGERLTPKLKETAKNLANLLLKILP
jgi:hydrogenase 3 maturation protease